MIFYVSDVDAQYESAITNNLAHTSLSHLLVCMVNGLSSMGVSRMDIFWYYFLRDPRI